MPNDNITTLQPRTYAVRRALEHYGRLHPSNADVKAVHADLEGFITDLIKDLYHLADEEKLQLHFIMENARKQATEEGAGQ